MTDPRFPRPVAGDGQRAEGPSPREEGERRPAPSGFPFTFRCRRSGNCCARPGGVVRVSPEDIERAAAHLGITTAAFRGLYVAASGDRLREGVGPACVFLRDGAQAGCAIYPVRPERCRSWPFWDELRDPDALRAAMRFCPGIEPLDPPSSEH